MRKIWLVAVFTLREAARRKALLFLFVAALLVVTGFGFMLYKLLTENAARVSALQAQSMAFTGTRMVLGLLNILATIAGIFVGASGISTDVESGSLHVLLPRTVTRTQVYLGKLLAVTLLIGGFCLAMTGGIGVASAFSGAGWPPGFHWMVGGFVAGPVMLAPLALAFSTRFSTLVSGLIPLLVFVAAQIGSALETVSSSIQSETLNTYGIVISLVTPVDAVYRWGLARWIDNLGPAGALGRTLDGLNAPPPSDWMLLWAGGWALAVILAGIWSFRTRDL